MKLVTKLKLKKIKLNDTSSEDDIDESQLRDDDSNRT